MRIPIILALCLLAFSSIPAMATPILTEEDLQARVVLEAIRRSYSDKIGELEWKNDDWTVTVDGELFYWAHGRILPGEVRQTWENYKPYIFYSYPETVPDPSDYTEEEVTQLREDGLEENRQAETDHHLAFRVALYGGETRRGVEQNLQKTTFLGKKVTVHKDIIGSLKRIERSIRKTAERDSTVAYFIRSLGPVWGYNWREIRGTTRRSFHSWGLAVDLQPKHLGSKETFWQWEQERNPDWMLLPLSRRWNPPRAVIKAFEAEGFIWGGKWDFWDTMHFEYRPELLEIAKVEKALGGSRLSLED